MVLNDEIDAELILHIAYESLSGVIGVYNTIRLYEMCLTGNLFVGHQVFDVHVPSSNGLH